MTHTTISKIKHAIKLIQSIIFEFQMLRERRTISCSLLNGFLEKKTKICSRHNPFYLGNAWGLLQVLIQEKKTDQNFVLKRICNRNSEFLSLHEKLMKIRQNMEKTQKFGKIWIFFLYQKNQFFCIFLFFNAYICVCLVFDQKRIDGYR